MTTIDTVAALAKVLNGVERESNLTSIDAKLGSAGVRIAGLSLGRLDVRNLRSRGAVELHSCFIRRLTLTGAMLSGGLVIDECDIGTIEVRSLQSRSPLVILQTRADSILLHNARHISLNEVSVTNELTISSPSESLSITKSRAGTLRITDDLSCSIATVELRDVTVGGDTNIEGICPTETDVVRLRTSGLKVEVTGDLIIERLEAHSVFLDGGSKAGSIALHGRSTTLRVQSEAPITVSSTLVVAEDVRVDGEVRLRLAGGSVGGTLRTDVTNRAVFELSDAASLNEVEAPPQPIRSEKEALAAASRVFAQVGSRELSLLRRSLRERPEEQDITYYAQRQLEASDGPWWRSAVFGGVLGWGVRLWPPVRSVCVGLLFTAVAVHVAGVSRGGEGLLSVASILRSLILALQLWSNVGVGIPEGVGGGGWAGVSVLLTALGLASTTLILGIVLRRLVR